MTPQSEAKGKSGSAKGKLSKASQHSALRVILTRRTRHGLNHFFMRPQRSGSPSMHAGIFSLSPGLSYICRRVGIEASEAPCTDVLRNGSEEALTRWENFLWQGRPLSKCSSAHPRSVARTKRIDSVYAAKKEIRDSECKNEKTPDREAEGFSRIYALTVKPEVAPETADGQGLFWQKTTSQNK